MFMAHRDLYNGHRVKLILFFLLTTPTLSQHPMAFHMSSRPFITSQPAFPKRQIEHLFL